MHLATLRHDPQGGWSCPGFPDLDSDRTLLLLFGPASLAGSPGPIYELLRHYDRAHVLGCSAGGTVLGDRIRDQGLTAAVVRFEHTRLESGWARLDSRGESFETGQRLASRLRADDLRAVLVLADGHSVDGDELGQGLSSVLPEGVHVGGGLSSGARRGWVSHLGGPEQGVVGVVGLYGDKLHVGGGAAGPREPLGPARRVTAASGRNLYTLDGKPALDVYADYLGDLARDLEANTLRFPLQTHTVSADEDPRVRSVVAVDRRRGSLRLAGDVAPGDTAQLVRARADSIIDGAASSGFSACPARFEPPVLSLAVSSVDRRRVLGGRVAEELQAAMAQLPEHTDQVGFYADGQLSAGGHRTCRLHNQTLTLTTLWEG